MVENVRPCYCSEKWLPKFDHYLIVILKKLGLSLIKHLSVCFSHKERIK